ncbi:glycosyltransferase family 2 protein [uncultured Rothia sp.]|uniref:glycosyltransferase family 2 protein n=1 Tax=uncultured Rothia sp. TaxID=316088 RepID=UPI0032169E86
MTSPRTSIIMPVYNTAHTVTNAIQSVLHQTDPNFELLILIDGSPDNSSQTIKDFLHTNPDPRIRLFDNPHNQGVSAVRNQGLDHAQGTWIAFLDSDDTLRPEFLEKLHAHAEHYSADIVGSLLAIVKAEDGSSYDRKGKPTHAMTGEEAGLSLLMGTDMTPYVCDKIVRASLFEGVRFPLNIHRGEDALTTLAVCMKAGTVVMTDEVLYEYLMGASGLTWGRPTPVKETLNSLELQENILGSVACTSKGRKALDNSRLIAFLNNAQQALFINTPDGKATIEECRRNIKWKHIASAASVNQMFAAAATLLKVSPLLYKKLYGAYVKRTYGL